MTETWVPAIGDSVRCTDNGYTGCVERPVVGQVGNVVNMHQDQDNGIKVLVIEFNATKENKLASEVPGKKTFKEYFCTKRLPYLFFEPIRIRKRVP
jgi:hypothetical protein